MRFEAQITTVLCVLAQSYLRRRWPFDFEAVELKAHLAYLVRMYEYFSLLSLYFALFVFVFISMSNSLNTADSVAFAIPFDSLWKSSNWNALIICSSHSIKQLETNDL